MSDISLEQNPQFKQLLSGNYINPETTGAFLAEVFSDTVGPYGIATKHLREGQGSWPALAESTRADKRKKSPQAFVQSGTVQKAIASAPQSASLKDWGSSADIFSTARSGSKRYTGNGIYAQMRANPSTATLTIGFVGKYKHSAGFNRARRSGAKDRLLRDKLSAHEVRRAFSVGETERRLKAINADRKARGLKTIRKTAAMGAKGKAGRGFDLARGKDNLAYADIVQRGQFHGLEAANGAIFSPKGIAARRGVGMATIGKASFGLARPLLPYKGGDSAAISKALERGLKKVADRMNSGAPWNP